MVFKTILAFITSCCINNFIAEQYLFLKDPSGTTYTRVHSIPVKSAFCIKSVSTPEELSKMAVFSPLVLIILSIVLMTLYLHWILTRKLKRWSHLPGPLSPLVFLIMSAFSSDNSVLLRRFYTKYQKVIMIPFIYIFSNIINYFCRMASVLCLS